MSEENNKTDELLEKVFQGLGNSNKKGFLEMLQESIVTAFDTTYPADGVDIIYNTINGNDIAEIEKEEAVAGNGVISKKEYLAFNNNWITRLSSFLGLPNGIRDDDNNTQPSWLKIAKNMIGWEEDTSLLRRLIISPLYFIRNTVLFLLKLPLHLLQLATELVPKIFLIIPSYINLKLTQLFFKTFIYKNDLTKSAAKRNIASYIALPLIAILFLANAFVQMSVVYFQGELITSPHLVYRQIWKPWGSQPDLSISEIVAKILLTASMLCVQAFIAVKLAPFILTPLVNIAAQQFPLIVAQLYNVVPLLTKIASITLSYAIPGSFALGISGLLVLGVSKLIEIMAPDSTAEKDKVEELDFNQLLEDNNTVLQNLRQFKQNTAHIRKKLNIESTPAMTPQQQITPLAPHKTFSLLERSVSKDTVEVSSSTPILQSP